MKPSRAKRQGLGLKASQTGDKIGKAGFAVAGHQNLPIRPAPVFQNPLGQPRRVALQINPGPVNVPEQVLRQLCHAERLVLGMLHWKNEEGSGGGTPCCRGDFLLHPSERYLVVNVEMFGSLGIGMKRKVHFFFFLFLSGR